ncbi:MAG: carboxymuconolactone decarboxylase family protein [Bacteroidales bacterium]|nr:carboxymuconolactone decarboxylase family protein [Bacteroidales bacterium]
MKQIFLTAIVVLATVILAACSGKTNQTDKDMTKLTFNERQAAAMAVIACNEARGDQSSLAGAIHEGFEAGLTANQMKEALSQLYAYTGFPRSLNALGTLQKVMEQRGDVEIGPESAPMPAGYDALKQGTEVQTKLSGQPFNYDFCPAEDYYLKAHLFGDIFARDLLTYADRELVTVSALSGLEGVMSQLRAHVRGALNMGVSEEQLTAIPEALKAAGLEVAALRCQAAIAAVNGQQPVVSPSSFPLGEPNDAYAQYFIGQSYLAVLDSVSGLSNVTFEPCCRNNWHIHHKAVQVLTCVSGRGWYQEWGKEPVELKPGTVVTVPAGTKHWHGAASDSWMQHLAYFTAQQPGFRNEWLEPVDDEQYNALSR